MHRPNARALFLFPALTALAGCAGELSVLDPATAGAAQIGALWWWMLGGSVAILALVMGLWFFALSRQRIAVPHRLYLHVSITASFLIVAILTAASTVVGLRAFGQQDGAYEIRVTARQWEWSASYPDGRPDSLNVIHAPAETPLLIELRSEDVIHSFWVPRLGGKVDAVPGRVTRLRLGPAPAGEYAGLCAEYCGVGHDRMPLVVVIHPAEPAPPEAP